LLTRPGNERLDDGPATHPTTDEPLANAVFDRFLKAKLTLDGFGGFALFNPDFVKWHRSFVILSFRWGMPEGETNHSTDLIIALNTPFGFPYPSALLCAIPDNKTPLSGVAVACGLGRIPMTP